MGYVTRLWEIHTKIFVREKLLLDISLDGIGRVGRSSYAEDGIQLRAFVDTVIDAALLNLVCS